MFDTSKAGPRAWVSEKYLPWDFPSQYCTVFCKITQFCKGYFFSSQSDDKGKKKKPASSKSTLLEWAPLWSCHRLWTADFSFSLTFQHGLIPVTLQTASRPSGLDLAASLVLLVLGFQCLGLSNCRDVCLQHAGGHCWTVQLPTVQINPISNLLSNYTLSAAASITCFLQENGIRAL